MSLPVISLKSATLNESGFTIYLLQLVSFSHIRFVVSGQVDFQILVCVLIATLQIQVALQFTDSGSGPPGIILKLGALDNRHDPLEIGPANPFMQHMEYTRDVMKFDCDYLSCFPEERETLFFGGDGMLRLKGITQLAQGKWMKYDKYLKAINVFSRMMGGCSVKNELIVKRKPDQKVMKRILKDLLRSLICRLDEAETPKYVHELMLFHHSSALRIQLIYDELLTEYKWLHCILKNHSSDTLDIGNIALLFSHSERITFLMTDNRVMTDVECLNLMQGLLSMTQMGLTMAVHFQWPSDVPSITANNLRQNELNPQLFDAGIGCEFHEQSVSFMLENVSFGLDVQENFRSRAELMIECLSSQEVNESTKPSEANPIEIEDAQHVPEPIVVQLNKNDIALPLQLTVSGFCREFVRGVQFAHPFPNDVSVDIQDSILFFYAENDRQIDFAAISLAVGVDGDVLREGLGEYENDMDRLISALVDVVYAEDAKEMEIWKALKIEDDQKEDIFRKILHGYFECTQLSTENMIKICNVMVQRMQFQIATEELNNVLMRHGIDGGIYDKSKEETYQNIDEFAEKFKSVPNCHGPHIRRLYNVIRMWVYV